MDVHFETIICVCCKGCQFEQKDVLCHLFMIFIVSFSFSIHVRLSAEEQMRLGYVCGTIHNSSE